MAEIAAFRGILYDTTKVEASRVLAPPYDVLSDADRDKLAALDPHNCVRLILPRDERGGDGEGKYAEAARTLAAWLADGTLRRDARPALYRYHQTFSLEGQSATRRGFICRVRLHRFDEGVILRHERTLAGPKADRLQLKRACMAHLSQVFGLYSDPERRADALFEALERTPPALEGKTGDGVEQRLWRLEDPAAHAEAARLLSDKRIYIADGHHRYETMLALRDELRAQHPGRPERSAIDFGTIFLSNLDDPSLLVFPTHRVVHGLPGFDRSTLIERARAFFDISDGGAVGPDDAARTRARLAELGRRGPSFGLLAGGALVYLTLRADAPLDRIAALAGPRVLRELDVTVLHAIVIESILGIDQAAQAKQTNLRYLKDTRAALAAGAEAGVQAVLLMNPTPVAQVRAVSDAGEVMPQKSTFFYPKLASGLVINPIDPAEAV
jgi:uncharacterized protein (DUF1015 family)